MKLNRNITVEIILCILAFCYVSLCAAIFFVNKNVFLVTLGLTLLIVLVFMARARQIKKSVAAVITGIGTGISPMQQSILSTVGIPVLITDDNRCALWYNDKFRETITDGRDIYLEDVVSAIEGFDPKSCIETSGCVYKCKEKLFSAYSTSSTQTGNTLYVTFFTDITELFTNAQMYKRSRPSVLMFTIDSYDELGSETKESVRAELLSEVYKSMEDFINTTNGMLVRLSSKSFIALIEEQHIEKIIEKRFPILDTVRALSTELVPVTMSVGIGRGAKTLYENYIQSKKALDMALGRGGDQAAMKTQNGYEFYGGVNRAVEKRNKVKSRIIATAMCDLMKAADNVVVMGHKLSDLDSLGACVGVARIAQMCEAKVKIVFNSRDTMARLLFDKLLLNGYGDLFVTTNEASDFVTENTLLVIVDCHTRNLVESEELLALTNNIMIIDHHRKMVGHIENTVLSYHEPYASSCCELVAELLQHIETPQSGPTKLESEGMLAGIMLDSRDFSVRTGVRTFEAASYLRRLGASPSEAKILFATDLETYRHKAALVGAAQTYRGCAVIVSDSLPENMRVVIPQAADDLLNIDGINASIVAVRFQNRYHLSARSLGAYNVQLIMEYLGGGGHQTMAGVQLEDDSNEHIRELIYAAIDKYLDANAPKQGV